MITASTPVPPPRFEPAYPGIVTRPIGAVLDATVAADPARPILTYYDLAADDRVELSAATLRNWVDKTANLLVDVVAAGPGSRISIALPTHWQGAVWVLACWRVGAILVSQDEQSDVSVVGAEAVAAGALPDAPEVVATALHPLGGRFTGPLPPGVVDYGADVLAQGDTFVPPVPVASESLAWENGDMGLDHTALLRRGGEAAQRLGLPPGGRLLINTNPTELEGAVTGLLPPLLVDGTLVLVRDADASRVPRLAATERVDVTAVGGPPAR